MADEPQTDAKLIQRIERLEAENARLRESLAAASEGQAPQGAPASFHAIADSVDQMIWTARPDGYHEWFNRRWYEFTGMPDGTTDGEEWNGMFHPEDRERAWDVWRGSLASGEPYEIEYRLRHRSGDYRWVLGRARPVRGEGGEIIRWYGSCTDIDELKRAEERVRRSEDRFRAMADSLPVPAWVAGEEGIEFVNAAFADFAGSPAEELVGQRWERLIHPDDLPTLLKIRERARAEIQPFGFEVRVRRGDGAWRMMQVSVRPRDGGDGVAPGYVGVAIDLTEVRDAEAALRRSEAQLRAIFDATPECIKIVAPDGSLMKMNHAGLCMVEAPGAEAVEGACVFDLISPEHREEWRERHARIVAGEGMSWEFDIVGLGGGRRRMETHAVPLALPDGTNAQLAVTRDVTQRREAEDRLRASESRLNRALEVGQIGDYEWDLRTGELRWSHNLMRIVGLDPEVEVTGETVFELIHPEDRPAAQETVDRAIADGSDFETSYRVIGREGVTRWIASRGRVERDEAGEAVRLVGVNYDVTRIYETEQRLRESEQRLKTLTDNLSGVMLYQVLTSRDMSERRYVHVSANSERLLGVPPEEAMADPAALMGIIDPEELEATMAAERRAADALETLDVEISGRRRDGSVIKSRIISRPRALPDGRLLWDGILIDITERKQAQEQAERTAALLGAIGDAAPDLIFAKGRDFRMLYANAATCRTIGIPPERLIGMNNQDLAASAEEAAAFDENDRRVFESDGPQVVEEIFTSPDGRRRIYRSAKTAMRDASGAVIGLAGVSADITERKEAEEALRRSEERLRVTIAAGSLGDWSWEAESDRVMLSPQAAALFGLEPDVPTSWQGLQALMEPEDAARAAAAVEAAVAERRDYATEYRVARGDGKTVWIYAVGRPIYDADGAPVGMIGAVQDITARREAQEALREESRTLETLNSTGAAVAAELDLAKLVQMVTDAGVELTGAQFGAFFYNVVNDAGESLMLYTLSGADPSQFDFGMPRATAVFHPTFAGEGVIRSEDITKDARYGLSAPHFGMPKGHLPVRSYLAVPVTSRSGEVIGGLFFGHPEPGRFTDRHEQLMTGIAAQAAIGIDNARLFQAAQKEVAERMRAEAELRLLNETLEQRVAEEVGRRAQAEEALRQAQKMETLGQLTGGVAHDFNNLLQIVSGNLDLLHRNLPEDAARLRRATENAMKGADRAAVLTQRLLAFSRRQPLAPKPIDVNRLVSGMSELLHRSLGETIAVETVLASGLWPVEADPHQLENAILNLAVNARDAMPDGGKLTVETANTHLDHGYAAQNAGVAPGQYVAICVSDSGTGMAPEMLERAFEPFFTTKDVGKGTGLGLSMVYGYVKQSGGHVKIYSEPGEGTTVKLYLPRLYGELAADEEVAEAAVPEGTRDETILVCEDDDDVRAYSVEVLRELGYRVLEAHDGPSALRLLERQEGRVDLLFTDVVLPSGMSGAEVAVEARKLRPDIRILFTTGYARNAIVHHGRLDPGVELITKPFSYADLAARIRDLLDAPA